METKESFSFQGTLVVGRQGTKGVCIKPAEQSREEMHNIVSSLLSAHEVEQDFVKQQYAKHGLRPRYSFDNPFVNRGG